MTLQELQDQALQLPIDARRQLVELLLSSIQQEMSIPTPTVSDTGLLDLNPWTQSLVGVVELGTVNSTEAYVNYLEEKYA